MNEQTRTKVLSMWSLEEKLLTQTGERPLHIYVRAAQHFEEFSARISIYDASKLLEKNTGAINANIDKDLWQWVGCHLLHLVNDRYAEMTPCPPDPLCYFFKLTGEGIQSLLNAEDNQ